MTVTLGEILGIVSKAKTMDWKSLGATLKAAPNNPALARAVNKTVVNAFSTAIQGFAIFQTVNDVLVMVRPIINLVREFGDWKNPAVYPKIGAEAISIIKSILMELGMMAISTVEAYVLNYEIDLGNLTSGNINGMNKSVKTATNKSYITIANSISGHSVQPPKLGLSLTTAAMNNAFAGLSFTLDSAVSGAIDMDGINAALTQLTSDPSSVLNTSMYGQSNIPDDGGLSNIISAPQNMFEVPDINAIENPQPTINTSYVPSTIPNTDTVREMLDAIEASIKIDLTFLFMEIENALNGITAPIDTSSLSAADAAILLNLTNGFLNSSMMSQLASCKEALNKLFNYNDTQLKYILRLVMAEISVQLQAMMSSCLAQVTTLINGFAIGMLFVDKQAAIMALLTVTCSNFPDISAILQKILFEYLSSMYSNVYVSNTGRQRELSAEVMNFFGIVRSNFLTNLIASIQNIRLENLTIRDDYYNYSYSSMKTSLQNYVMYTINTTPVSSLMDYNNLKINLSLGITSILNGYSVIVSENIPHSYSENIIDKINELKNNLYIKINELVNKSIMPPVDYSEFTVSLDDGDRVTIQSMYKSLYSQYTISIINKAKSLIDMQDVYLKPEDLEYKLVNHTSSADLFLKNSLFELCSVILNSSVYQIVSTSVLSSTLVDCINNYKYILNFATTFSAYLKELEIDIIQNVIRNINA